MNKNKNNTRKGANGLIWIFLAGVLWSLQGVLGKVNTWSPVYTTGFRAISAAITIGLCRGSFVPSKQKRNWIAGGFVAITGVLFLSVNSLTTSANAVAIQYTMPVFVILIGLVIWRKRPTWLDIVCSLIMMAGVVFCFYGGFEGGKTAGNAIALLSAVSYAFVFLSAKFDGCDALSYSYQGSLISSLIVIVALLDKNFDFSWGNFASAIVMGVFVGLGYVFFAKGFEKGVNSTQAAIVSYIEPVLNPIWVMVFVGEKVSLTSMIGITIVLLTSLIYSVKTKNK